MQSVLIINIGLYMGVGVSAIHWNVTPHRSYLGLCGFIALLLRALVRIGNVHLMERIQLAIKYFDKSVGEHRSQDIVKKNLEVRHFVGVVFFFVKFVFYRQRRS